MNEYQQTGDERRVRLLDIATFRSAARETGNLHFGNRGQGNPILNGYAIDGALQLGSRRSAPMAEIEPVDSLIARARQGDSIAWGELVDRYAGLVWSVCRRHRLSDADAADASQTVWLRLTEHLDEIRNPAGLASWLYTTAGRACLRIIEDRRRQVLPGVGYDFDIAADAEFTAPDRDLLAGELHLALLAAIAELPERHRQLLALLLHDPPLSYQDISDRTGMPIGTIGPTRGRIMDRLRHSPSLAAFTAKPHAEERR
jgi:RNA polymerase sigma factor (sigma-70 family)